MCWAKIYIHENMEGHLYRNISFDSMVYNNFRAIVLEADIDDKHKSTATLQHAVKSVLFIFVVISIGCLVKQLLKKYHLPYTVGLFVLAVAFGCATNSYEIVRSYEDLTRVPANILMQMFLPILIFESAYTMDSHFFLRSLTQCLLLAVPGLVTCAVLTAGYSKTVLSSYNWDWKISFIFGCILSATDPVAVVAMLKEAGISPALTTLIEGESLLNDGSAIVIFGVLIESVKVSSHGKLTVYQFLTTFVRVGLGAPVFGYVMGLLTSWSLLHINNDAVLEFSVTFCSAFLSFYMAEEWLGLSGVLTVVAVGVVVNMHKSSFSPESEEAVHSSWETMAYFANTLIFSIVGIIISQRAISHMDYTDIFFALATYIAVTFFRFAMVLLWSPFLRKMGYGLPWKHAVVLIWGGLRGAVGLALALMLYGDKGVAHKHADQILIQLSMIIILTLVVNGVTMKYLLQLLGLNEIPQSRQVAMAHAVVHLRGVASKSITIHKRDKFLGDANWLWIESHTHIVDPYNATDEFDINCLYTPFKTSQCPHCHEDHTVIPTAEELDEMTEETRLHVLKALKVCYWKYFEHGLITRDSVDILISLANEAIDRPGNYIDVNSLTKCMEVSIVLQELTHGLTAFGDKLGAESFREVDEDLIALYNETTGIRHRCLQLIISPFWEPCICFIIITNVIPIVMEVTPVHIFKILGPYCIFYTILASVYLFLFICEATIKIIGLGWKLYIKNHYNKFALFLVIFGAIDVVVGTYISIFYKKYYFVVPLIRLVRLFRLIELYRLFWKLMAQLVGWLKNKTSARLYRAFDLGRGYQMAQNEVMERINYVVDYKPCAVIPMSESEHGVLEVMKRMSKLQVKNGGVVIARKSHIAAIKVLNDISIALDELHESGLLEVVEYERLKMIIYDLKLQIQNSPKFLSSSRSAKDILKKVDWLCDKRLLKTICRNYVVKDYKAQQIIHEAGQMGNGISIITSGVVKVTGTASEVRTNSLPNTDSFLYFTNKENFFEYVTTGYSLGLISTTQNAEYVTTAVCETDVQVLHISTVALNKADALMSEKPSLTYILWKNISIKIALPILLAQPNYGSHTIAKVNLKLESCVIPDLKTAVEFTINKLVEDMVLIQGKVRDPVAGKLYIGPCYIPKTVQHMVFFDQPDYRPRIVIVIIVEEGYIVPEIFDWSGFDSSLSGAKLCLLHTVQHRRSTIIESERKRGSKSSAPEIISLNSKNDTRGLRNRSESPKKLIESIRRFSRSPGQREFAESPRQCEFAESPRQYEFAESPRQREFAECPRQCEFSETPHGYAENPRGYAESSRQCEFVESPRGYAENPCGYAESPHGYAENPRRYAESPHGYAENPRRYAENPHGYAENPHEFDGTSREFAGSSRQLVESSCEFTESPREFAESSEKLVGSFRKLSRSPRECANSFEVFGESSETFEEPKKYGKGPIKINLSNYMKSKKTKKKPSR